MGKLQDWLDKNEAYYEAHPNEIIYAHQLIRVLKLVAQDLEQPNA